MFQHPFQPATYYALTKHKQTQIHYKEKSRSRFGTSNSYQCYLALLLSPKTYANLNLKVQIHSKSLIKRDIRCLWLKLFHSVVQVIALNSMGHRLGLFGQLHFVSTWNNRPFSQQIKDNMWPKTSFEAWRLLKIPLQTMFKMFLSKKHFLRQTYPIFSATEPGLSPVASESKSYTWKTDREMSVSVCWKHVSTRAQFNKSFVK